MRVDGPALARRRNGIRPDMGVRDAWFPTCFPPFRPPESQDMVQATDGNLAAPAQRALSRPWKAI